MNFNKILYLCPDIINVQHNIKAEIIAHLTPLDLHVPNFSLKIKRNSYYTYTWFNKIQHAIYKQQFFF